MFCSVQGQRVGAVHVHPFWDLERGTRYDVALLEIPSDGGAPDAVLADTTYPMYPNSKVLGMQMGKEGVEVALLTVIPGDWCRTADSDADSIANGGLCLAVISESAQIGNALISDVWFICGKCMVSFVTFRCGICSIFRVCVCVNILKCGLHCSVRESFLEVYLKLKVGCAGDVHSNLSLFYLHHHSIGFS